MTDPTRPYAEVMMSVLPNLLKLHEIWEHALVHRCINVAARLGIADLLVAGELTLDDLAQRTGSHGATLYRVLRLLCAHGIFVEGENATFALTPTAECLRSDVPWSLRWGSETADCHERAGTEILHAVRTGECPFETATGITLWDYLSRNAEAADWFDREMQAYNVTLNIPAFLALEWERAKVVADIAGGTGKALSSILSAHPHLKGILVDQPQVVARARAVMLKAGLETRCEIVGGDIFNAVPAGADTYILSRVLHDWDDDHAVKILKVIRKAMVPGCRLMILEMIVPPGNLRHPSKASDISMLLLSGGGRERTEREFSDLLHLAGLRLERVVRSCGAANILEATLA
jgi:O-methyltransferase domain